MGTNPLNQYANDTGPLENAILVQQFAAATPGSIDLSALPSAGYEGGNFITVVCQETILYYRFSASAGTVDETATSGANRAFAQPAGVPFRVRIPDGARYLLCKTSILSYVRVYESDGAL